MVAVNLVAVGMQGPQGPPGPAGSDGSGGLPAWFLTSSTTGSHGAPYGAVTPNNGPLPCLYWDDTNGSGLWISLPESDNTGWQAIGGFAEGNFSGLLLGSGTGLAGSAPGFYAIEGEASWDLVLVSQESGTGYMGLAVNCPGSGGALLLGAGDPNVLSVPGPFAGAVYIDASGTGIWQWNAVQATPGWVPYGPVLADYQFQVVTSSPYGPMGTGGSLPLTGGTGNFRGYINDCISVPAFGYQPGQILSDVNASLQGIPPATDGFDLYVQVTVASLDGSNVMYLGASADAGADVDGTEVVLGVFDLGDGQIGTDLTWDNGTGVSTTAGGVYGVVVTLSAGWD